MTRLEPVYDQLTRDQLIGEVLRLRRELDEQLQVGAERARRILRLTEVVDLVDAWRHAPFGEVAERLDALGRGLARYQQMRRELGQRRWDVEVIDADVSAVRDEAAIVWRRDSADPQVWHPLNRVGEPIISAHADTRSLVYLHGPVLEVSPEVFDGR